MTKFNELHWHFEDGEEALELYATVSVMPQAFGLCPSIEKTKDMEAKMPPALVRQIKETEAERLRKRGLSNRFISEYLRMEIEDPFDMIPDETEPEDFPEKDRSREQRINRKNTKKNIEKLRMQREKARVEREKTKLLRKFRHAK